MKRGARVGKVERWERNEQSNDAGWGVREKGERGRERERERGREREKKRERGRERGRERERGW